MGSGPRRRAAPFTATYFQSKGDPITDLFEDMAAEQKARTTYDNILRLVEDPEISDPIRFLRAREVVHYQRFGEALRITQEQLTRNFLRDQPRLGSGFLSAVKPIGGRTRAVPLFFTTSSIQRRRFIWPELHFTHVFPHTDNTIYDKT